MSNRASLGHIYDQLKQDGYIDSDAMLQQQDDDKTNPWFIEGLMGCGGWIAAFFLLGTISICITTVFTALDETTIGFTLMVIGVILTVGTVAFNRFRKDSGVFVSQLSLMIHIAGQSAFFGGLFVAFALWREDSTIVSALAILITMQVIFIWLYPNVIYRFIAMLVIAGSVIAIDSTITVPILNSIVVGILFLLASLIWLDRLPVQWQFKQMRLWHPVAYGSVIGALGILIYEISNRFYLDIPSSTAHITGGLLTAGLLLLIVTLLRDYEIVLTSPFAIAVLVFATIVSVIVISTPGIIAGIVVILLAFRRRNVILQGIGYGFLAGFIVYYYYWLDVSLLMKSIILVVTGVVLLVGRFGLNQLVTIPDAKKGISA